MSPWQGLGFLAGMEELRGVLAFWCHLDGGGVNFKSSKGITSFWFLWDFRKFTPLVLFLFEKRAERSYGILCWREHFWTLASKTEHLLSALVPHPSCMWWLCSILDADEGWYSRLAQIIGFGLLSGFVPRPSRNVKCFISELCSNISRIKPKPQQ